MKVLVVGAGGMTGHTVMRVLSEKDDWEVFGTVRNASAKRLLPAQVSARVVEGVDVECLDSLSSALEGIRPHVVINCVGLTKHRAEIDDPLKSIPINSLLPHRLAKLCQALGARLVHLSTDCVFSGEKGFYREDDFADARDLYGKSKALGEVTYPHTITFRTSFIGHELESKYGLVEWFLAQRERCKGYTRAVFSGLPTVVFAQILRDVVVPNPGLSGLYNLAAKPITKYELLMMIAKEYGKTIEIVPDDNLKVDRSLDARRFQKATGYVAPPWIEMIKAMHAYGQAERHV